VATVSKFANAFTAVAGTWTNPGNAYADDGVYATAAPGKNASITIDFGFPAFLPAEIPAGSKINSVTVEFQFKSDTTGSTGATIGVQVNDGGTLLGTESLWSMGTSDLTTTKGDSSGAVTLADLQLPNNVRARVRASRSSSNTAITWSLDYVKLTVDYTLAAAAGGVPSAGLFGTVAALAGAVAQAVSGVLSAQAFSPAAIKGVTQIVQVPSVFPPLTDLSITNTVICGDGSLCGGNPGNQFGPITVVATSGQSRQVAGIGSAQAFGAITVKAVTRTTVAGLGSAQAFGAISFRTTVTVALTGLGSAQAFGAVVAKSTFTRQVAGIPSAQAFGTVTITKTVTVPVAGVGSAQAFSMLRFAFRLPILGVGSAQAFGTVKANLRFALAGIPTAQAFGAVTVRTGSRVTVPGVPSAQAFGAIRPSYGVNVPGVGSAQAFGLVQIGLVTRVAVEGVPSAQAFGAVKALITWIAPIPCTDVALEASQCLIEDAYLIDSICGLVICGDGHLCGGEWIGNKFMWADPAPTDLPLAAADAVDLELDPADETSLDLEPALPL